MLEKYINLLSNIIGINNKYLLLIGYSIIAIIIIILIIKTLIYINTKFTKDEKTLYLTNKRLNVLKIVFIVLSTILIWEHEIQNIITFISFIGAATTLALRDIIVNFFAGIYITIYKPFKLEDRIEISGIIGDVVNTNSLKFEVLEVNSKEENKQSTGIIVEIPNSKIFSEPVKNYTKAFKYIWSELEVKINLNANLEENKKILYDIVRSNDIVKKIPKKMKNQLTESVGNYRIYYNNLDPIIYTKINEEYITLTIRYLAHPKKERFVESQIWNKIYENAKENKLDLYTKEKIND